MGPATLMTTQATSLDKVPSTRMMLLFPPPATCGENYHPWKILVSITKKKKKKKKKSDKYWSLSFYRKVLIGWENLVAGITLSIIDN